MPIPCRFTLSGCLNSRIKTNSNPNCTNQVRTTNISFQKLILLPGILGKGVISLMWARFVRKRINLSMPRPPPALGTRIPFFVNSKYYLNSSGF